MTISMNDRLILYTDIKKYPVPINMIFNNNSNKIYLGNCFNNQDHLIKSFTAVYIAAKTPRRERTIVKTGVFQPVSLSSLTPPQTVIRIIPII